MALALNDLRVAYFLLPSLRLQLAGLCSLWGPGAPALLVQLVYIPMTDTHFNEKLLKCAVSSKVRCLGLPISRTQKSERSNVFKGKQ